MLGHISAHSGHLARKIINYLCEDEIEKSVSKNYHLSSLGILMMPNSDPQEGFIYPTLTFMKYSNKLCTWLNVLGNLSWYVSYFIWAST